MKAAVLPSLSIWLPILCLLPRGDWAAPAAAALVPIAAPAPRSADATAALSAVTPPGTLTAPGSSTTSSSIDCSP